MPASADPPGRSYDISLCSKTGFFKYEHKFMRDELRNLLAAVTGVSSSYQDVRP